MSTLASKSLTPIGSWMRLDIGLCDFDWENKTNFHCLFTIYLSPFSFFDFHFHCHAHSYPISPLPSKSGLCLISKTWNKQQQMGKNQEQQRNTNEYEKNDRKKPKDNEWRQIGSKNQRKRRTKNKEQECSGETKKIQMEVQEIQKIWSQLRKARIYIGCNESRINEPKRTRTTRET